ncbi:MAG: hypothetical protein EA398_02580 [Deltaproteobacteria bacterium]|nr:MAG: hypothetical protein EA398_02580 [Deltaproteobacteria bacterium]
MNTIKCLWDFHGDDADERARRFESDLREKLAAQGWEAHAFGTGSAGPGHAAAFCVVDDAVIPELRALLRPQRGLPGDTEGVN